MRRPSSWQAWWLSARPATLSVTVCPVLAATALAWGDTGRLRLGVLALTLLAALLIQIGTNLLNDVGDYERGADASGRLGPPRATAQGWLAARAVRRAGFGALGLALACGAVLAASGGWPIVLLGVCALCCGWAYTAGPRPIAYGPFGEVFVWVFFGLAAVAGTYWLQAGALRPGIWLLGHALGALAAAVMLVNNTRDAATDALAGKRTLAVAIGLRACRTVYAVLVLLPFALLPWLPHRAPWPWWLLPAVALPLAGWLIGCFMRQPPGRGHNRILARTAALELLFTACWLLAELALAS